MNDTINDPQRADMAPVKIGGTTYWPELDFDGCRVVLRDEHGDVPPGDPDGDPNLRSTQVAYGHKHQELYEWEYRATTTYDNVITPPAGDGWELNTLVGVEGHEQTHSKAGRSQHVTYWRRRDPQR